MVSRQLRCATLDGLFVHDGGIHTDGVVEETLGLSKAHVHKVAAVHGDLSIAVRGSARHVNAVSGGGFVVQKVNGLALEFLTVSLVSDRKRNNARLVVLGCSAFNFILVDQLSSRFRRTELAHDFLVNFEVRS